MIEVTIQKSMGDLAFYSSREYPAACGGDESGWVAFELQDTARLAARRFIKKRKIKIP
jgi:hypothetical protein